MTTPRWAEWLSASLDESRQNDRLRSLQALTPVDSVRARAPDGRELLVFSSNDYLGLSTHPAVRRAASEAAQARGNGPRSSPLICGYTSQHAELEGRLALLKRTASCLLVSSGFSANVGVLGSLGASGVTVFSDRLNHASIIDGCRLAQKNGARLVVYDHADPADLRRKLRADNSRRKLIVTDSVFSMDGDAAPLTDIVGLAQRHEALTVIDEAHATLVYGENGGGLAEALGVAESIDIHVGTLSKAFGSHGGFIATTSAFRTFFLNRGRPYVFSTALPTPVVASALAAMDVASDGTLRAKLRENIAALAGILNRELHGPIVPIVVGSERDALHAAQSLYRAGILVPAIRPPTVPDGTCRLRVTLSAAHRTEDIEQLGHQLR